MTSKSAKNTIDMVMVAKEHDGVSNQTTVDQRPVERSTVVWFDDGSCVLQAENKVFKVYSGMLAKYSGHFQTMLSLPQPTVGEGAEPQPMYENCPVIPLLGDSAKDAEYFLRALSDLQFYADVTKIKDIDVVLAVINLSLKYEADILLHRSIPAFTALYPASLAKWNIREQRRQYTPFVNVYGRALPYVVIAIAKKTGMDVLLPSAMFECCSYSINDIMDGVAKSDGKYVHLDHASQRAILKARVLLSNNARAAKTKIVHTAQIAHPTGRRIGAAHQGSNAAIKDSWQVLESWAASSDGPDGWVNPLRLAEGWPVDAYSAATRVSLKPAEAVTKGMKSNYPHLWKKLPAAFGLQDWDKLRRSWIH